MAAVIAFRVAIALGALGTRLVTYSQGPAADKITRAGQWVMDLLGDEGSGDIFVSEYLEQELGYPYGVATWNGTFECRRVHIQWTQNDAVVGTDDVRVATIDLLKLTGGVPDDQWDAADFVQVRAAFNAWWLLLDTWYSEQTSLHRIAVYRVGPFVEPPQPPAYETILDLPGTTANNVLPPQCAVTVTEMAGAKPHWGRFYMPSPTVAVTNLYGRFNAQTEFADATDALYQQLKGANLIPVVYRKPLGERMTKAGSTLPPRAASAWSVDKIQVDDVFDVMRSRRWKTPLLRVQRDIA